MTNNERAERVIAKYKELKEEKIKLEERLSVLQESMKKDFGVSSAEELKRKIDEAKERAEKLEDKLDKALTEAEETLGL